MTIASRSPEPRLRFHPNAYRFVFDVLRHTQDRLGRTPETEQHNEDAHISGGELLQGIREYALQRFGLMTITVFRQWGIHETDDFGRIVFELVERGDMRKTDRDQQAHFRSVYDFHEVFDLDYRIDTSRAFRP